MADKNTVVTLLSGRYECIGRMCKEGFKLLNVFASATACSQARDTVRTVQKAEDAGNSFAAHRQNCETCKAVKFKEVTRFR